MAHSHFIRKTLGIKDKNIQFKEQIAEETIKGQNHLVLYGKLTYTLKPARSAGVSTIQRRILLKTELRSPQSS